MKARKWISNSPDVMAVIPAEDHATELTINDSQGPVTKTLGLSWNSSDDVLTIPTTSKSSQLEITKRNVLKKIATIFDPLGLN
jgi:outer membrane lipopolysaccharide assembly protein LptE/RlpB